MSRVEASESLFDSIEAVAIRLLRWGRIAPSGLARVEYISDASQAVVLDCLRNGFGQAGIPFVEITLQPHKPAIEQVRFLIKQLALIKSGVVSITGFAQGFPEDVPLVESLRVLNFNRENLADFSLCQIWWMPRDFTQMFRQSVPDLNSWFILKLRLNEITPPLNIVSPPEKSKRTPVMSHEEGVKASNFYASRFRTALQRQENMGTLWQLWANAVDPLLDVGRINEAVHLQEALLQEANENGSAMHNYLTSELSSPTLMNKIGRIYFKERRLADAELLYQKALTIRQAGVPQNDPDIATSLNNLAELYVSAGRYAEAEPLYQRALTIRQASLPQGHPDIALSLNNLAELYYNQGRYAEAESLYQEALTIDRHFLPQGHPDIASSLNDLAGLYRTQGRFGEAESLFQEAVKIRRDALPQGHPDIALSLNNLAELYYSQGRYAEAEPLYQEAAKILMTSLGSEHPNTRMVTANYQAALLKIKEKT